MKNTKQLLTAGVTGLVTFITALAIADDCDTIQTGSLCATPQSPTCANDCTSITYTPSGPSQTCTPIGEDDWDSGYTPCNEYAPAIWKYVTTTEECSANGTCLGCNGPAENFPPTATGGWCEQDSIDYSTATQCGPWNN